MDLESIKKFIRNRGPKIYQNIKNKNFKKLGFDTVYKFPELREVLVDLLTIDFGLFVKSIDLMAPKPSTFRVSLKNNQYFNLIYNKTFWTAEVEGKLYNLSNINQSDRASKSISRILQFAPINPDNINDSEGMDEIDDLDME